MQNHNIAIFIDVENASAKTIDGIIKTLKSSGKRIVTIRGYADWTLASQEWKRKAQVIPMETIHRFHPVKGKNSSDVLMTCDVMECLFTQLHVTGFCFVTSDSDFSSVITKVRNNGKYVIAAGESTKSNQQMIQLCNEFIYTDKIEDTPINTYEKYCEGLVREVYSLNCSETGISIAQVGIEIKRLDPLYSATKLKQGSLEKFLKSISGFEIVVTQNNVKFLKQVA